MSASVPSSRRRALQTKLSKTSNVALSDPPPRQAGASMKGVAAETAHCSRRRLSIEQTGDDPKEGAPPLKGKMIPARGEGGLNAEPGGLAPRAAVEDGKAELR